MRMNANQYFNYLINTYPSILTSETLDDAKFKFYDHVFNTIGNGIHSVEDFDQKLIINKKNKDLIDSYPEKYTNNEDIFYGYVKVKKYNDFEFGDGQPLPGLFTEEEKNSIECREVKYWLKCKKLKKNPYPNFQKAYSLIWCNNGKDIQNLDKSWIEGASWYYLKAKEYFQNEDNHSNYHYGWPKEKEKQEKLIQDYTSSFNRLKSENQTEQEFFKLIEKEYACYFDGDVEKFIKLRWTKELISINKFLDETLELLESNSKLNNLSNETNTTTIKNKIK